MGIIDKTLLILIPFFFFIFICSASIHAQPFGILSQESGITSQKQVLSTLGGRYVFGQISNSGKDQYMLDTLTGRLWKMSERGDLGVFLISVPYCTADGKCAPLPEETSGSTDKTKKK